MNPGRELDALVAEKVMGIGPRGLAFPKKYSTDIAAAWEAVETLTSPKSRHRFSCTTLHCDCNSGLWSFGDIDRDGTVWPRQDAHTAPHAICLAALRVVGAI